MLYPTSNLRTPLRILACAGAMAMLAVRHRPHVVVTTGALPGLLAVVCGRLVGGKDALDRQRRQCGRDVGVRSRGSADRPRNAQPMARPGGTGGCHLSGIGPVIFVTTGTKLPFPRLIGAMNARAPALGDQVIARIGPDRPPIRIWKPTPCSAPRPSRLMSHKPALGGPCRSRVYPDGANR